MLNLFYLSLSAFYVANMIRYPFIPFESEIIFNKTMYLTKFLSENSTQHFMYLMFFINIFPQGKYLTDTGFVHNQVKVQIGKGECEVKSIQFLLSCKPPKNQPTALGGGQYPEVIVSQKLEYLLIQ